MKIKKSRAIQHIHTHDTYMYNAYIDVHGYRGTFLFHIWMENRPFGCVAHEVFDAELKSDRIRLYWDYFTLQTLFIRHFLAGDVFYLIIIYAFISLWIFFQKLVSFAHSNARTNHTKNINLYKTYLCIHSFCFFFFFGHSFVSSSSSKRILYMVTFYVRFVMLLFLVFCAVFKGKKRDLSIFCSNFFFCEY